MYAKLKGRIDLNTLKPKWWATIIYVTLLPPLLY